MLCITVLMMLVWTKDSVDGFQKNLIQEQLQILENNTETIVQNGKRLVSVSCGNKTDTLLAFHPNSRGITIDIIDSWFREVDDIIPGFNFTVTVSLSPHEESFIWYELTSSLDDLSSHDEHVQYLSASCDTMISPIVFQYRITHPLMTCVSFRLQFITSDKEDQLCETTKTICRPKGCRKYMEVLTSIKLKSPNYPENYPDDFDCTYVLYTTSDLPIHLQHFSLENAYDEICYDSVTITTDNSDSLRLCGHKNELELKTLNFISKSGVIMVEFNTDSKIVHSGFEAIVYIIRKEDCNNTLDTLNGTVTSPFYPNAYPPLLKCMNRIVLPDNYRIVMDIKYLNFELGDQSCQKDYVQIESVMDDGTDVDHGRFCEKEYENVSISSSSSELLLQFSSDYFLEGKGFYVEYQGMKVCENITNNSSSGVFMSVNFPGNYLNNIVCMYSFGFKNEQYVIELEFDVIDLEADAETFKRGSSCTKDYIEITTSEHVERICGRRKQAHSKLFFYSETGFIEMSFRSDLIGTRQGFSGRWRMVLKEFYSATCRDIIFELPEYRMEYIKEAQNWRDARESCLEKGGDLVKVLRSRDDALLQEFLYNISLSGNCSLDHKSIWIGGNDLDYEGGFQWANGELFQYKNWFLGWPEYEYRNRQPSDDGLSNEDCVEMRKTFHVPSKGNKDTDRYYWNDRNCDTKNPFICQYMKEVNRTKTKIARNCSFVFTLNDSHPFTIVTSPNFPENYSNFDECDMKIYSPVSTNIAVDFIAFDIEFEENCSFDNLSLSSVPNDFQDKVYCGNWSRKTKLLRWISKTNFAQLYFHTDQSITSFGFKLNVSLIFSSEECISEHSDKDSMCSHVFFVKPNHITLAQKKCKAIDGDISNLSSKSTLFNFITYLLQKKDFVNITMLRSPTGNLQPTGINCLSQIILASGEFPYFNFTLWNQTEDCKTELPFICRKKKREVQINPETTILTENKGVIIHPREPMQHYGNNEKKTYHLIASSLERIFIEVIRLDVEFQDNCLYDYVQIYGLEKNQSLCGNLENYDALLYWSVNNTIVIHFHSDDSVAGKGFDIRWQFFRPSACIELEEKDEHQSFRSINFPYPYPDEVNCCQHLELKQENLQDTRRLLVVFTEIFLQSKSTCLSLSNGNNTLYETCGGISTTNRRFLSSNGRLQLCYNISGSARGEGFQGFYNQVPPDPPLIEEVRYLAPGINDTGIVSNINYPSAAPKSHVQYLKLRTDLGYRISLVFQKFVIQDSDPCEETRLSVFDTLYGKDDSKLLKLISCRTADFYGPYISFLNRMTVVFETGADSNYSIYRGIYTVEKDTKFLSRTIHVPTNSSFDECSQNSTCLNGGNCTLISQEIYRCKCPSEFTGLFCQVTLCEAHPCGRGICNHTQSELSCICGEEFWGHLCNLSHTHCDKIYCNGHGQCIGINRWKPECQCNNNWSGKSCSKKVMSPSAMPSVTSKLLKEPIWVGMIVILNLLFVFGSLYIMKKKCGKYVKCCQDTKEILRRREDGIPAHSNDPIPQCPTLSEHSLSEIAVSVTKATTKLTPNLHVENDSTANSPTKTHTPRVSISNKEAAARLFASYKSDDESIDNKGSTSPIGGLLEGALVLSNPPVDRLSVQVPELILRPPPIPSTLKQWRFNHTASIPETEDRRGLEALTRCHSVAVTNPSLHGRSPTENSMHDIYILNENTAVTEPVHSIDIPDEHHRSVAGYDSRNSRFFSVLGAKDRRRAFAEKSKSAYCERHSEGKHGDIGLVENRYHEMTDRDMQLSGFRRSFNDYTDSMYFYNDSHLSVENSKIPCSLEPRTRANIQRLRLMRDGKSNSEPQMEHRYYSSISFSDESRKHCKSESALMQSRHGCKRKKYMKIIRAHNSSHSYCSSSYADSDTDMTKSVSHLRKNSTRTGKRRTYNKRRKHATYLNCNNTLSDTSITSSCSDKDRFYSVPVRKSKSNDLKLRQPTANRSDEVDMMVRPHRHSFSSNGIKSNVKDPDEMLNEDQIQPYLSRNNMVENNPKTCETNIHIYGNEKKQKRTSEAKIPLQRSFSDSVSSSAVVSVNDTDTGFSSSSKSFKSGKDQGNQKYANDVTDLKMSRFKTISSSKAKDSAYQTNQSSVERFSLDVDRKTDIEVGSEKGWVYHQLQQAALKLIMYDTKSRSSNCLSKDSAVQGISEDDCLNGYEYDNSLRDTNPRRASLPGLFSKSFPLEQVSEETDNPCTPDTRINTAQPQDYVISDVNEKDNTSIVDQRCINLFLSPPSRSVRLREEIELDTISV